MAKISKTVVDSTIRSNVFAMLINPDSGWKKINDRQYGMIVTDLNGVKRYVRLGAIVAEEREDMTAEELMVAEIEAYQMKQAEKAEKAQKRAAKAEKDKARRKAEAEAKAKEENANA